MNPKQLCKGINKYDNIIVTFSGGKDSTACLLHLFDLGVDRSKIELWHHDVDGIEGSKLMDWPVTRDYCKKIAEYLEIPIYFSWRKGGFEAEMLRENKLTNCIYFECPDGTIGKAGGLRGKLNTRLKFPQVTANLSQRWCSAYLKIDVYSLALNNQKRFLGKRILVISGERAQESAARAKYQVFEPDRCDGKKRTVNRWRPIHKWNEKEVWEIIKKYKVNPHPAYHLGWGRLSCKTCIFGSKDQWASCRFLDPEGFEVISDYEKRFDKTIHRTKIGRAHV